MATQQEVMQQFMASLDKTTLKGTAALDEAIKVSSGNKYSSIQAVISDMKKNIDAVNDSDKFLKEYCGIILDNADTGAITGSDAGGTTTKTAQSIVPEVGTLKNFTGDKFTVEKYGITFCLAKFKSNGLVDSSSTLTFADLKDSKQKYIWQGLYTWWAEKSLDLISESYGSNFGFKSSHLIEPKTIFFGFFDGGNSTGLSTAPFHLNSDTEHKATARLSIAVNMNAAQYGNIDTSDPNGKSSNSSNYYLDRAIAHELTHAAMSANINHYYELLQFISEGMAEITHGADDSLERQSYMKMLASKNSTLFDSTFNLNKIGTGDSKAYAGGYMFLRYFAKQAASSSASGKGIYRTNTASNTSLVGTAYNDTLQNIYSNGVARSNVTILGAAGADNITNYGSKTFVDGGNNNDTIYSGGDHSKINGGAGNDSIYVAQASAKP